MRLLTVIAVTSCLISTDLLAAEADAPIPPGKAAGEANGPLSPGKPAGIAKAQQVDNTLLWTGLGLGAAGIIILATQGGSESTNQTTTTTTH